MQIAYPSHAILPSAPTNAIQWTSIPLIRFYPTSISFPILFPVQKKKLFSS